MGRLNQAMARLASRQLEVNGESITYTRGAVSLPVTALIGRTAQPADDANGRTSVNQEERDFLLDPSEILFGGSPTDPRKGDRITYDGATWEVWPTIGNEQCWSPSDTYGHMIRIHTRREA